MPRLRSLYAPIALIVDGIAGLPVETCMIDGEAIVVDQNGLSVFDLLRYRQHDHAATLCAFDLLELDGADLRSSPTCWPHGPVALRGRFAGFERLQTSREPCEVCAHCCSSLFEIDTHL